MPPKKQAKKKRSGRMAKKGGQVVLQEEINTNEDWEKMLEKPGLYVIDVYTEWCGPCVPMIAYLKKIKLELGNESLHYAIDGKFVNLIIGANAPRLMKVITDEVERYEKFKKGEIEIEFISMDNVTSEEQRKLVEKEQYEKQKMKKEKKIRDDRMMKVREHSLKKFSVNVQMQTCVVFFPHTITYVMVEKPSKEDAVEELEELPEPIMIEKRVCEVANLCALKYEEFIVVEAKEIQLTEDTLEEMFSNEKEVLESFSARFVDELLNKKVYSVMLSLPTIKNDAAEEVATEDENPPDPVENMGLAEKKMSTIIYGNGNPLYPTPKSLAAENMIVNDFGEKLPSLYTPTNPLSKTSALTVLFNKFCINNGYVAPQPPSPQYLIIFEVNKSNVVLPIIEDLEDNIYHYGFFRSADPENPRLLCKDHELLTTYGMDKIGKDAKLVLSVVKDDKDKSMLRFVDVGPIYVSPDSESGIDDAIKFFPHDFDEMEGEIKLWLVQQLARDEEAAVGEEFGSQGEGKEECLGEEEAVTPEES
ncbi:Thioredoxin-like fold,Domain of unknown function DUF4746,Thioredoxin, conserved site [Cinara cedri]|uniref:DUF4746 domain-containing protein n=1 Tax=Cinara cedri TaxID=506608 RepID=A0A5E4MDH2_9HEMI|nr:Thioredoxin-like fold,Domain of unknown function DUF4746,Thioredoxin, conserved site [Cinara cedri]